MEHKFKAAELFIGGYNCAQAVMVAFCDVTGLEESFAANIASAFGGGMGRMREVCGAVSGMYMVLGRLYGYDTPGDDVSKTNLYHQVQDLASKFREQAGSIICREILGNPPSDPNPTPRTEAYYKVRPCARLVMLAAELMDQFISEHPIA